MFGRNTKTMRPQFDSDEEYIVAYYRQYQKSTGTRSIVQEVTAVAISTAFFLMGFFKGDVTWSIVGFCLLAFLFLRGQISGARYNRTIASVIGKYEDAVKGDGENNPSDLGRVE